MKKVLLLFALAFIASNATFAQLNPVKWSYEAKKVADNEYDLILTAHVNDGWYIYSQTLESDMGPIPTSFNWGEATDLQKIGDTKEDGLKHEGYDEIFDMNVVKYSGHPTFTQRVKINKPTSLSVFVEYMTCDNDRCLPPTEIEAKFNLQ
ncbi:MAG: protein-disulfide reductase DsbD domain-containing protein [Bacteroidota bacterium]